MTTHIDGLPDFSVPSMLRYMRDKAALDGSTAKIVLTVDVNVPGADGSQHSVRTSVDLTIDELLDVLARREEASGPTG